MRKRKNRGSAMLMITFIIVSVLLIVHSSDDNDYGSVYSGKSYYNGTSYVCRVYGCGNSAIYSNWDDRFCAEHLYKSLNHAGEYDSSVAHKKYNTKKALTEEEAEALRGTGFHNTRPNSSAENTEIKAAMRTCPNCGMYADQGSNNLCYACRYNKEHGFD